jgi:F0F1-type ATP synthase membrane subunit b/b'
VIADRESVVDDGRKEAGNIIAEAHKEREHMLSDTEVFRVAKREAEIVLEKAQIESDGLRKEADEYVDSKLANFEVTLQHTIESVRRGRERLAGRTAFHALDVDDVDGIALPEHLDS